MKPLKMSSCKILKDIGDHHGCILHGVDIKHNIGVACPEEQYNLKVLK